MDDILTEDDDAGSKTVDARVLTDRHTHTQIDRHDQFYDSCPSKATIKRRKKSSMV